MQEAIFLITENVGSISINIFNEMFITSIIFKTSGVEIVDNRQSNIFCLLNLIYLIMKFGRLSF